KKADEVKPRIARTRRIKIRCGQSWKLVLKSSWDEQGRKDLSENLVSQISPKRQRGNPRELRNPRWRIGLVFGEAVSLGIDARSFDRCFDSTTLPLLIDSCDSWFAFDDSSLMLLVPFMSWWFNCLYD